MSDLENTKSIWERLWDHDPNGLLVVDRDSRVLLVNLAFCEMFGVTRGSVLGRPIADVLEDPSMFTRTFERLDTGKDTTWSTELRTGTPQRLFELRLFAMESPTTVACIFVDMSERQRSAKELRKVRDEAIAQVEAVVDKHMKVAQEIAGLLGEATAETKVSLIKLMAILRREID
jgi:PAS domain S-box-containing protein